MRNFLNEDELLLLKETCLSGEQELLDPFLVTSDVEVEAFKSGISCALKTCSTFKLFSQFDEFMQEAKQEGDLLSSLPTIELCQITKISHLDGRVLQTKFLVDRLLALRYLNHTLDIGIHFIPAEHILFVKDWKSREEVGCISVDFLYQN